MKPVSKTGSGSKEIKKYDEPANSYQRLMDSAALSQEVKDSPAYHFRLYNPMLLQHNVNKAILKFREHTKQRLSKPPTK